MTHNHLSMCIICKMFMLFWLVVNNNDSIHYIRYSFRFDIASQKAREWFCSPFVDDFVPAVLWWISPSITIIAQIQVSGLGAVVVRRKPHLDAFDSAQTFDESRWHWTRNTPNDDPNWDVFAFRHIRASSIDGEAESMLFRHRIMRFKSPRAYNNTLNRLLQHRLVQSKGRMLCADNNCPRYHSLS